MCNGQHSSPPCDDPQCWHKEFDAQLTPGLSTDLSLTLAWKELRTLILDAIMSGNIDHDARVRLLTHMSEHWSHHAPRQVEFHSLEQRMRLREREIETLRTRLKGLE